MPVVVADVLVQHHRQVPSASDQEPVSALAACCSHSPLRVRVRQGSLRRGPHHLHALVGQNDVERGRVLGIPVADQEPERPAGYSGSITRLRAHG